MIDLFGLIKNAFVVVVTTISVLNPFNTITQNKVDSSLITPSPVLEKSVDFVPENPATSKGSTYQNSENKIKIEATDEAGNKTTKEIKVTYSP